MAVLSAYSAGVCCGGVYILWPSFCADLGIGSIAVTMVRVRGHVLALCGTALNNRFKLRDRDVGRWFYLWFLACWCTRAWWCLFRHTHTHTQRETDTHLLVMHPPFLANVDLLGFPCLVQCVIPTRLSSSQSCSRCSPSFSSVRPLHSRRLGLLLRVFV